MATGDSGGDRQEQEQPASAQMGGRPPHRRRQVHSPHSCEEPKRSLSRSCSSSVCMPFFFHRSKLNTRTFSLRFAAEGPVKTAGTSSSESKSEQEDAEVAELFLPYRALCARKQVSN